MVDAELGIAPTGAPKGTPMDGTRSTEDVNQDEELINHVTKVRAKLDAKRTNMTDFEAHDAVSRLETVTIRHHTATQPPPQHLD